MTVKLGFAFHVHHDVLCEWCTDLDERVKYIKSNKPKKGRELRLRLLKLIPVDRLPPELLEAWCASIKAGEACDNARKAYLKAGEACDNAWEAYHKAWDAYHKAWEDCDKVIVACVPALIQLHTELCPNCPWDGKSIFKE